MHYTPEKIFRSRHRRPIILAGLLLVVGVIFWNSYLLFRYLKQQERTKMEIWSQAVEKIISSPLDADIDLPSMILIRNKTIPVIMTDSTGRIIQTYNLPGIEKDTVALRRKLAQFAAQNDPLRIQLANGWQELYYGNSRLLNQLTWYPVILIIIFLLFAAVVYLYYKTTRVSEQNLLWAGMAKEAAHQIGTPLSSLLGWLELLKTDPTLVEPAEMEKDIQRLRIISERFAKIGSRPKLQPADLRELIQQSVRYFRARRLPENIRIHIDLPEHPLTAMLNPDLFRWVLENLIKNAIDAMPEGGEIRIGLVDETPREIRISIADTGKGIPKNLWKKIFEPGFTTKKRGWGLGLSLVKRIVENYHRGRIFVYHSEPGKGTEIHIKLHKPMEK